MFHCAEKLREFGSVEMVDHCRGPSVGAALDAGQHANAFRCEPNNALTAVRCSDRSTDHAGVFESAEYPTGVREI